MEHQEFVERVKEGSIKRILHYEWLPHINTTYAMNLPEIGYIKFCHFVAVVLFLMMLFGWAVTPWKWYVVSPISFVLLGFVGKKKEDYQEKCAKRVAVRAINNEELYYQMVKNRHLIVDGSL